MSITEIRDGWAVLFDQGGIILWVILALSIFMWALILERYWFFQQELPQLTARMTEQWRKLRSHGQNNDSHNNNGHSNTITSQPNSSGNPPVHSGLAFLNELLTNQFRSESRRHVLAIQTLTNILPMLGLLGTVSGMIAVFDVITEFGSGNTRGMAAGISRALVTTMAGLLTALSGLYFASYLENRIEREAHLFSKSLDIE